MAALQAKARSDSVVKALLAAIDGVAALDTVFQRLNGEMITTLNMIVLPDMDALTRTVAVLHARLQDRADLKRSQARDNRKREARALSQQRVTERLEAVVAAPSPNCNRTPTDRSTRCAA